MPRGTLRRVPDSRRVCYGRLYYRLINGPRLLQGGAPGRRRKTGKAPLLGNHLLLDLSYIAYLFTLNPAAPPYRVYEDVYEYIFYIPSNLNTF